MWLILLKDADTKALVIKIFILVNLLVSLL